MKLDFKRAAAGATLCVLFFVLTMSAKGCAPQTPVAEQKTSDVEAPAQRDLGVTSSVEFLSTESLFDGKSLDGWELTSFGGEGDCFVKNGVIVMNAGDPVTAINLPESHALPTKNYELLVEAKKVDGSDFFSTLTFPVNDSFCSFVVGGWGGTLVGLSSIDGQDASNNDTRTLMKFDSERWYQVRVRVTTDVISCWIDDKKVVEQNTTGKKISLRSEMVPCRPLGIASFITTTAIRKVELRTINVSSDGGK